MDEFQKELQDLEVDEFQQDEVTHWESQDHSDSIHVQQCARNCFNCFRCFNCFLCFVCFRCFNCVQCARCARCGNCRR